MCRRQLSQLTVARLETQVSALSSQAGDTEDGQCPDETGPTKSNIIYVCMVYMYLNIYIYINYICYLFIHGIHILTNVYIYIFMYTTDVDTSVFIH